MTDNTPATCPRNEQAIGWALHSLEPDEEIAVLSHLPVCPSCRQAADDAEAVLGHLGAAVEQVDPPPALRNRLMAQVADTPQKPPAAPTPPTQPSQQASMPPSRDEQRGSTRPADTRPGRGSRWSRRTRQLFAGALALVAVLAIGGLAVRNVQLQQERDAQIAQIQSLENLLDQFDRPDVYHALLARDDGSTIAAVVVENGRQQVFPIGVPANATDRDIYVLWGIHDGSSTPEPLGTFDVTDTTEGPLDIGSAGTDDYAAYAISIEPGRAAPAVPTTVVASGAVAA